MWPCGGFEITIKTAFIYLVLIIAKVPNFTPPSYLQLARENP
jgi:hypothetical protein